MLGDSKIRILLLEDNAADQYLIAAFLGEANGFSFSLQGVDRVSDGLESLSVSEFDLVLLDLSLPDASGLEGFERIRRAAPRVPIIVLTGLDDDASAVAAVNAGAQDYLVKGWVDGQTLIRSIRYAIERHQVVARLHESLEREQEVAERLRESQRRFRSLVASMPGAVYRREVEPPWTCDFMSEAVSAITGCEAEDFVQRRRQWEDIVHPEDVAAVKESFHESIDQGTSYRVEYRILRADGGARWVVDRGMPVYGDDGTIRFLEGVVFDITQQKRAEDVLKRLRILEDRERIARELHDGVIQSLFALGSRLQAAAQGGDTSASATALLEEAVGELDRIIRDLRGYIFALRPSLLGGIELERDLRSVARAFEGSKVRVTAKVDPAAAWAMAERGGGEHLVQASREALSNAVRHSGCQSVTLALYLDESSVVLRITDDGRGFASAPFAGHGLINLRARAESLGGTLHIASSPESGTTVALSIPQVPVTEEPLRRRA
jgi:PAS domain S-box-containing protein